jgi:hypothetical protein
MRLPYNAVTREYHRSKQVQALFSLLVHSDVWREVCAARDMLQKGVGISMRSAGSGPFLRKARNRSVVAFGSYRSIEVNRRGAIEWVTLSRPKRFNAIHLEMAAELVDYFARLTVRQEIRVVLLRGAGRHFCAGFDLDNVKKIAGAVPNGLRMQRVLSLS